MFKQIIRKIILKPLSKFFRIFELPFIKYYGNKPLKHQPVFIIGAPRTGSTILYQAITNVYDVAYIDNLAGKLYSNIFFGMWLSNKKYGNCCHNNFLAEFGTTSNYGAHAPSESGEFWYRWLPKDRHFIDSNDLSDNKIEEIRQEITAVSNYQNKPLVFKNLNAGQRLRMLVRAFPEARFIFVRRDPRFTLNSILNARKKIGIKENEWWSIMPKNYESLLNLNEIYMCGSQIYSIERQIIEDQKLFPTNCFYPIHYQNFSESNLIRLGESLDLERRNEAKFPVFKKDIIASIDARIFQKLENTVANLKFDKEIFVENKV